MFIEFVLKKMVGLDLEEGMKEGSVVYVMLVGLLYIVGVFILGVCL